MFLDLGGIYYLDRKYCRKIKNITEFTDHLNDLINKLPISCYNTEVIANTNQTVLTLSITTNDEIKPTIYEKYLLLNVFGTLGSYGFTFVKIDEDVYSMIHVKNSVEYVGRRLNLF